MSEIAWKCGGCGHGPHGSVCLANAFACSCNGQPEHDVVCQHGTAADVHCCGCHSGFLFSETYACVQTGADLIAAERQRQIAVEGYTPQHDDTHEGAELLQAAVWYLDNGSEYDFGLTLPPWPWEPAAWKPSDDRVKQLAKAGALIAAEIDRLKRQVV